MLKQLLSSVSVASSGSCGGVFEQLARYTMRYQESDLHLAFILHNLLTTSAYSTSTLLFLISPIVQV